MLKYLAAYQYLDASVGGGVQAEVIDFPGAMTWGHTLEEARELLADSLQEMVLATIELRQPIPVPDPQASDPEADLEEPIYLLLTATSQIQIVARKAI